MPKGLGRLGSIPAAHDALGNPNLSDETGGSTGETHFAQPRHSTGYSDITKAKPVRKNGDLKWTPDAGV